MPGVQYWLARHSPLRSLAGHDLTEAGTIVLGVLGVGSSATLSIALTSDLGFFFGLCFVIVVASCALAADLESLFTPGVMPPLLMIGLMSVVASGTPDAITVKSLADTAGMAQRVIAGLVDQATALVIGELLALAVIGLRYASAPEHRTAYERR